MKIKVTKEFRALMGSATQLCAVLFEKALEGESKKVIEASRKSVWSIRCLVDDMEFDEDEYNGGSVLDINHGQWMDLLVMARTATEFFMETNVEEAAEVLTKAGADVKGIESETGRKLTSQKLRSVHAMYFTVLDFLETRAPIDVRASWLETRFAAAGEAFEVTSGYIKEIEDEPTS